MALLSIFVIIIISVGNITTNSENSVTNEELINGQLLVKLGRQMDKPMLTLIGLAIQNLHPCEEWTSWTECKAKRFGQFGIRQRTRSCNAERRNGDGMGNVTTETDWSLCEGNDGTSGTIKVNCPSDYNFTSNGFCIKLYTTHKSHEEASKQCQQDGGYLINVDSEKKYVDMKSVLRAGPANVNVGGRRKGSSTEWEFDYGENNGFYSNHWYSGSYPVTSASHSCLYLQGFLWWNSICGTQYPFLCEII